MSPGAGEAIASIEGRRGVDVPSSRPFGDLGHRVLGRRTVSNTVRGHMPTASSPSQLIDARIKELGDWRGDLLARIRALIKEVDPDVVEEWKWRGTPTWYHDGIICTGETYKKVVKMTFAKGASLSDPAKLFNSSLEGNVRRAIDFHEGDQLDRKALKDLIRAAVELNTAKSR